MRAPRLATRTGMLFAVGLFAMGWLKAATVPVPSSMTWPQLLAAELCGWLGAWPLLPIAKLTVVNTPSGTAHKLHGALFHLLGFVVAMLSCVLLPRVLRELYAFALGVRVQEQSWVVDLLTTPYVAGVIYAGLVALFLTERSSERRQVASLHAFALEAQLAASELDVLAGRLDPQLLFDALGAIRMSMSMQTDLGITERLIQDLAELSRERLARDRSEEFLSVDASGSVCLPSACQFPVSAPVCDADTDDDAGQ